MGNYTPLEIGSKFFKSLSTNFPECKRIRHPPPPFFLVFSQPGGWTKTNLADMKTYLIDNLTEKQGMMNKSSIEERDERLIKKFRNIVEEKEQLRAQFKQQVPHRRSWYLLAPAGFILAAGIIFMVYHTIPERTLTDPSSTPEKFETASQKKSMPMAQHPLTDVEKPDLPNEK
ncbi:MAG TPA: hypothetical protein DCR95_02865, partial [Desulfobacter sp.]|nr:hypothetical protein [Desulfobacter sp.]